MPTDRTIRNKILTKLLTDARKSYRTIANELEISTTTVSRAVKEMEDDGIILGYIAMIDWQKLGYDAVLCLQVQMEPKANVDTVGTALRTVEPLKQIFYTTGEATFSAYAICKDNEEAASVLSDLRNIQGVERVVPHTVLKTF